MTDTERAFVRAICADPAGDPPRLPWWPMPTAEHMREIWASWPRPHGACVLVVALADWLLEWYIPFNVERLVGRVS